MAPVLRLPPIYLPVPDARHPDAATLNHRAELWLNRQGLCNTQEQRDRLVRARVGNLAAAMAPYGALEPVQLIADFMMWNIAFDDEFCDEGPLSRRPQELTDLLIQLQRTIEAPETPVSPGAVYHEALRDIRVRMDSYATPAQIARWVDEMRGWFMAEIWKAGNVARGVVPSLSDFLLQRLYSGGGLTIPVLASIAEDIQLTDHLRASRTLRAATEAAVLTGSAYTDLASYAKERHSGQGEHNLIDILQRDHNSTVDQAITTAVTLLDRTMHLFLTLKQRLERDASDDLARYLRSLGSYIRAAVDWTLHSTRYQYPHASAAQPAFTTSGWTDQPRTHDITPPPIPSIAWWWQVAGSP
ncbi:terpene synthase family protein [Streptomyces sp. NPDC050095]|uniref:terpene synthase family protein n=1 Tax=unclassified Streptomyces TaxID=2593676 RepID=UPI00343C1BDC